MKFLIVAIALTISTQSFSAPRKATCESLQEEADITCEEAMCEAAEESGEACVKDGDYYEGHQICAYDEFQALLKKYNSKNSPKLVCEE